MSIFKKYFFHYLLLHNVSVINVNIYHATHIWFVLHYKFLKVDLKEQGKQNVIY